MKLSELVKLRNNLQDIKFDILSNDIDLLDAAVSRNLMLPLHENYKQSILTVIDFFDKTENSINEKQQNIKNLIEKIDDEITAITSSMLELGYKVNDYYGSNLTNFDVERVDRILELSDDERGEIGTVLRSYTNWRYPTLEIGPGDGEWTESLVAGDPLYIVDRHQEFLDSTLRKFNEVYQRRLRPYLTGIHADRPEFDYTMLPQGQFGFIFAWNVINFWPLKETKHTLHQCWDLLKPGGVMMFSFNNCDVVQCAVSAETGYKSYLTPKLLNDVFAEIGFEVIQYRSTSINVHWVEIKKPGVLQTSKRHQTLGKIISLKPDPEVDTDKDNVYNEPKYSKEEIANLKRQALFLKIDSPEAIYKAYSPEQLEYLINQKRNNK